VQIRSHASSWRHTQPFPFAIEAAVVTTPRSTVGIQGRGFPIPFNSFPGTCRRFVLRPLRVAGIFALHGYGLRPDHKPATHQGNEDQGARHALREGGTGPMSQLYALRPQHAVPHSGSNSVPWWLNGLLRIGIWCGNHPVNRD